MEIEELKTLGRFLCVDGSISPAFKTMEWDHYKKTGNAIKLHLALELNRMLPVKFISTDANTSEKKALLDMLEKGVTYIADRGYMSFSMFNQISLHNAFFIIRVKSNLVYTQKEALVFKIPLQWQPYISHVTDCKVICNNDKRSKIYRLITFVVNEETYFIMANCFDLKHTKSLCFMPIAGKLISTNHTTSLRVFLKNYCFSSVTLLAQRCWAVRCLRNCSCSLSSR